MINCMPALIGGFFRRGHFITVTITNSTQSMQSIAALLQSTSTFIYSKTPVNSSTTQGGGKGSGLNTAIKSNEAWL